MPLNKKLKNICICVVNNTITTTKMSTPKEVKAMIEALNDANKETLDIRQFYAAHEGDGCMHEDFGLSRLVEPCVKPRVEPLTSEDRMLMVMANHWVSYTNKEIWNRDEGEFEEFVIESK